MRLVWGGVRCTKRCVLVLRCPILGGLTDPLCWSPAGVGGRASGWGVCLVARVGLWVCGVCFVGFSGSCKNSCLSLVICQVTETAPAYAGMDLPKGGGDPYPYRCDFLKLLLRDEENIRPCLQPDLCSGFLEQRKLPHASQISVYRVRSCGFRAW